jgi:hypothetical protein
MSGTPVGDLEDLLARGDAAISAAKRLRSELQQQVARAQKIADEIETQHKQYCCGSLVRIVEIEKHRQLATIQAPAEPNSDNNKRGSKGNRDRSRHARRRRRQLGRPGFEAA